MAYVNICLYMFLHDMHTDNEKNVNLIWEKLLSYCIKWWMTEQDFFLFSSYFACHTIYLIGQQSFYAIYY